MGKGSLARRQGVWLTCVSCGVAWACLGPCDSLPGHPPVAYQAGAALTPSFSAEERTAKEAMEEVDTMVSAC